MSLISEENDKKTPDAEKPAVQNDENLSAEGEQNVEAAVDEEKEAKMPKPGIADYITGENKSFVSDLSPHLPRDLVGGSIPYIPGTEDEAVWNAASQACGTERVSYSYTVEDNRCWYLACSTGSLASNPDSWCPLAAALPGGSEFWDRETVYLYEQEGQASALRWDPETGRMQVFLGASRTLLPRIQSMDANFVTIDPVVATKMPWRNRALRTEKLARATAKTLLYVGISINLFMLLVLVAQYFSVNMVKRDLAAVQRDTEKASTDLMINAYNALQSDAIKHMVRIQDILDAMQKIDGTLVKYEVNKKKITWEALVPPSFSGCTGILKGCKVVPGLEKDGRVRLKGSR